MGDKQTVDWEQRPLVVQRHLGGWELKRDAATTAAIPPLVLASMAPKDAGT